MNFLKRNKVLFFVVFFVGSINLSNAQISVEAGIDQTICPGTSVNIGGSPTASGSVAPYSYSWTPAASLNNATTANPVASPSVTTTYYLIVKDFNGDIGFDSVIVSLDSISLVNAGSDTSICENTSVVIGGSYVSNDAGITYLWSPAAGLSSTTVKNPTANPSVTTTYNLTVKGSSCPSFTVKIQVSVYPPPAIVPGPSITIDEGDVATLSVTGAKVYQWLPQTDIKYDNTPNPEVEPKKTITYYVFGTDNYGCWGMDSVIVTVRPRSFPVFFNTFTPNGDGVNDLFYVGNLGKFPNNILEIYNRYGKIVYQAAKYANNWDGRSLGENLPAATYYYIFDPGNGEKAYKGSVTIIR